MNILEEIKQFVLGVFYHTPEELLNDVEIEMIKSNGLIHFCKAESAESILKEGVKGNLQKPMRRMMKRNLTQILTSFIKKAIEKIMTVML